VFLAGAAPLRSSLPLGTIGYFWPIHWACHVNIAYAAYSA
jgi:hypothetical protein